MAYLALSQGITNRFLASKQLADQNNRMAMLAMNPRGSAHLGDFWDALGSGVGSFVKGFTDNVAPTPPAAPPTQPVVTPPSNDMLSNPVVLLAGGALLAYLLLKK